MFARIRRFFRVEDRDYTMSLRRVSLILIVPRAAQAHLLALFYLQTVNERFSEGASGAFMASTEDSKYVIKSMKKVRLGTHAHAAVVATVLTAILEELN